MKIKYRTSVEKWEGLKEVASEVFGDETLVSLCDDLIRYIKKKGDRSLDYEVVVFVDDVDDFRDVILHSDDVPCPHCVVKRDCSECELHDGWFTCCEAWDKIYSYLCDLVDLILDRSD